MNETRRYFEPDFVTPMDDEVTLSDAEAGLGRGYVFERGEALGRYLVLDKLGQGGMGVVLAAYDSTLDRRVALKLLHPHTSGDPEQHARMLREAQALAKLSHPAVVSVYDVGEIHDHVFIAMEFIDGSDLRAWTQQTKRTPAEILAVYRDAARGLQAAHDAGIVHRDLKPDNILIGSDGHARVTDFGLALDARVAAEPSGSDAALAADASSRLTETGIVMGTPAYMPPEQHRGQPTDHRSDQFSFCVSLYHSLYGVRPFAGANGAELCVAIERGEIPGPPPSVSVPRRVHRAIVKGLSADPNDRFPSMRAFIKATTPPARKGRNWIGAGVIGIAAGASAVTFSDPRSGPCSTFDDRVKDVFGASSRARIQAAFLATDLPLAQSSHDAALAVLDDFAHRWSDSAAEACMATERGEQSERMLDLRMHCLDRALFALESTADVFSSILPSEVPDAPKIAANLPDLAHCADLDSLRTLTILPETPEHQRDADTLVPVLERVKALFLANRVDAAANLLEEHRSAFEASTYPLVDALYLLWDGRVLERRHDAGASAKLRAAHLLALEHGLDVPAVRSAAVLGHIARQRDDNEEAMRWFRAGMALAEASGSARIQVPALLGYASVLSEENRLDEAVEAAQRALDLIADDETFPPRPHAEILLSLARHLYDRDGGDAGKKQLEDARMLIERTGELTTLVLINNELTRRATQKRSFDAALALAEEGVRLTRLAYKPESANYASALANLGVQLRAVGRHEEAIARYAEALEILEKMDGLVFNQCVFLANATNAYLAIGDTARSRSALESLSAKMKENGFEGGQLGMVVELNWSAVLRSEGNLEGALTRAQAALELSESAFGPSHFHTASALASIARIELEQGHIEAARAHSERAIGFELPAPDERALVAYVHGRTLWASQDDRARALEHVRAAYTDISSVRSEPALHTEIARWLEAHDPSFTGGSHE